MADSFFGFNTALGDGLYGPLEDEEFGEEEKYDAFNDETFGSEAPDGDWEQDHEKLAQITESARPSHQNSANTSCSSIKNDSEIDIENSLSHLVLDEKEGIIPRPGVWESPTNLPIPKPKPPLTSTLKNVCTVEELERGLIANRPPPGLKKPSQPSSHQQSGGFFDSMSINEQLQLNGIPPRFPPGLSLPGPPQVVLPPNLRLPHPQFMQNHRMPNQGGNLLRYPLPPHLMMQHGGQRQPMHGNFSMANFPPSNPNMGPLQFMRPDHPMIPFANNQGNHQQHNHPLHSANQRNQNRSFQHNEQQGNHQPFFKNNQYPYHNQNHNNQRYQNQHHGQGMNGSNGPREYDEYAGLMSSREKQWLNNIQLLQLNTNQPYVDDYYYTVFCDRQNKKNESEDPNKKNRNNGHHKDSRDREQTSHTFVKVVYTPTQFENSLGKLQCGSVTAPRKIIDMDIVPNSDPQQTLPPHQKDTKKTRQLLLEIERLYVLQLKLDDVNNPLALIAEQQQQEQQENDGEPKVVKKTESELIAIILSSLLQLLKEDKLAGMLSIRKGKTLLLRFLPYVSVTEYKNQLGELWTGLLRGLAIIGRRDSHLLVNFYTEFRRWIHIVTDFSILLQLAKTFKESASQPTKTNSLAFALTNKFGVSVIASLVEQAEALFPSDDSSIEQWSNFVVTVVNLIGVTSTAVVPCEPIAVNTLNLHLNRIRNLEIERYKALELLSTDANTSR
ncbi:protein PAT1 homolog 1 isoform X2 [Belonocnema kinseyi]|uniref:protein PAT1 homolog 1 isoform X2 n=1 Tax=Belonocnema kinseyi TaxID=2817044 RepID=UPI00143CF0C0|nr:protein PAT1 homolog 1 isoform X2 [Belonocnema kinseyi]